MRALLVLLAAVLLGCSPPPADWVPVQIASNTTASFDFQQDAMTKLGVRMDRHGDAKLSLDRIDHVLGDAASCVAQAFGSPPVLPSSVRAAGMCSERPPWPVPWHDFGVRIAGPGQWLVVRGDYGGVDDQALAINGPCDPAKGTPAHPDCHPRVAWQLFSPLPVLLYTPPADRLLASGFLSTWLGCDDVWADPTLAACAQPEPWIDPLSDGSTP